MISKKEEDIMVAPKPGTSIPIKSYKHNGHLHRTWDRNLVLKSTNAIIIGANDKVKVTESNGETWTTKEPAIVYFHAEYWFNIIGIASQLYYLPLINLSSVFTFWTPHAWTIYIAAFLLMFASYYTGAYLKKRSI